MLCEFSLCGRSHFFFSLSCLRSLGSDLQRRPIITSLQSMFKVSLPSTHSNISNFCIHFQAAAQTHTHIHCICVCVCACNLLHSPHIRFREPYISYMRLLLWQRNIKPQESIIHIFSLLYGLKCMNEKVMEAQRAFPDFTFDWR